MLRRISGRARFLSHEEILLGHARRGHQQDEEYYRTLSLPFALLESRIRNVFAPYKNGKKP